MASVETRAYWEPSSVIAAVPPPNRPITYYSIYIPARLRRGWYFPFSQAAGDRIQNEKGGSIVLGMNGGMLLEWLAGSAGTSKLMRRQGHVKSLFIVQGKLRSLTETKRPAINRQAFFLLDCRGTSTLLFISAFWVSSIYLIGLWFLRW
jgi:hypothetical protein